MTKIWKFFQYGYLIVAVICLIEGIFRFNGEREKAYIFLGAAETSDAEYSKVVASYTSGGMTISANYQEADNTNYTTAVGEDYEYTGVSLSFAF